MGLSPPADGAAATAGARAAGSAPARLGRPVGLVAVTAVGLPTRYRYVPLVVSAVVLGLPHDAIDPLAAARVAGAAFIALTWFHWGQGDRHAMRAFVDRAYLPTRRRRALFVAVRDGFPMLVPLVAWPDQYRTVVAGFVARFGGGPVPSWPFDLAVRAGVGTAFACLVGWWWRRGGGRRVRVRRRRPGRVAGRRRRDGAALAALRRGPAGDGRGRLLRLLALRPTRRPVRPLRPRERGRPRRRPRGRADGAVRPRGGAAVHARARDARGRPSSSPGHRRPCRRRSRSTWCSSRCSPSPTSSSCCGWTPPKGSGGRPRAGESRPASRGRCRRRGVRYSAPPGRESPPSRACATTCSCCGPRSSTTRSRSVPARRSTVAR